MKILTQDNYYEDKDYLSVSLFKEYIKCEARAFAIDRGDWKENRDQKPLLIGNYVHSKFESHEAHQKFIDENKQFMFSSRKPYGLLSDYKMADKVIECLERDNLFKALYHGKSTDSVAKELIITGVIEGVAIKGKIDSINLTKKYMVDLKTMKTIRGLEWSESLRQKVRGVEANFANYRYDVQFAVYLELLRQMYGITFKPFMVAVSKEDEPDKEILEIAEEWLVDGLKYFKEHVVRVNDVIHERVQAERCEVCDYCRHTRVLTGISVLEKPGGMEYV